MTDDRPEPAQSPAKPEAPQPPSYEAAAERLERIIERLDSGAAGLRETHDLVDAVGKDLDELRLDDLIARLESNGPQPDAEGD
jgi:exodeoxyribonuclease VII small subunit